MRFRKADPLVAKSNLTAFQPLPRPSCETQILSPVCVAVAKPISAGRPIRWLPSTTRCSRDSLGPGSTNDHLDSLQPIGRSRAPSGRTQRGGHLVGDRPRTCPPWRPTVACRDVDGGDDVPRNPTGAETPTRPAQLPSTDAYPAAESRTGRGGPASHPGGGGQSATCRGSRWAPGGVALRKWSHHRVIVSLSQALSSVRPAGMSCRVDRRPSQPIPRMHVTPAAV